MMRLTLVDRTAARKRRIYFIECDFRPVLVSRDSQTHNGGAQTGGRTASQQGAELNGMRKHTCRGIVGLGVFTALVVVLWVTSSCTPPPSAPAELRVGLLALLHGVPKQTSGLPSVHASELAAKLVNDRGGVTLDGRSHNLRIVVASYEDRADSATSVARALINQERIDALIGPQFSRHAIPVAVVAEDARVPMLSPMSSNPATTKDKSFVFRLAFLDNFQGDVMGRFAAKELDARRAAVLYDRTTAYGRSPR